MWAHSGWPACKPHSMWKELKHCFPRLHQFGKIDFCTSVVGFFARETGRIKKSDPRRVGVGPSSTNLSAPLLGDPLSSYCLAACQCLSLCFPPRLQCQSIDRKREGRSCSLRMSLWNKGHYSLGLILVKPTTAATVFEYSGKRRHTVDFTSQVKKIVVCLLNNYHNYQMAWNIFLLGQEVENSACLPKDLLGCE